MCRTCIDRFEATGNIGTIFLATGCVCPCDFPSDDPQGERVCSMCSHAHSTPDINIMTPEGVKHGHLNLDATPSTPQR